MRKWIGLGILGIASTVALILALNKKDQVLPSSGNILFPVGRYTYTLAFTSKGSINTAVIAQSAGAQSTQGLGDESAQTEIYGKLQVKSERNLLELNLADIKVKVAGQDVSPLAIGLGEEPVQVGLDSSYRFISVKFPANQKALVSSMWLSLLAQIQVVHNGAKASWSVEETDFQAQYLANYRYDSGNLQKMKSKVVSSNLGGTSKNQVLSFGDQKWLAELGQGSLQTLTAYEEFTLSTNGIPSFQSMVDFRLERSQAWLGTQNLSDTTSYKSFRYGLETLNEVTAEATEESRYRQDMGSITFDEIIAGVQKEMSEGEETEFYKKVRGFIHSHPERCRDFESVLIEAPYNSLAMNTIAVAMGRVGHEAAQASLRNIIQGRIDTKLTVTNYLHLLAQSKKPTPESLDLLEQLSRTGDPELREAAVLSSGSALSSQRLANPVDAMKRLEGFRQRFETSSDPQEKNLLLDLIGNSEMPEGLDIVNNILADNPNAKTRELAIEAMRMMNDSRARSNLLALLASSSLADRESAANALKYQAYMPEALSLFDQAFETVRPEEAKLRRRFLDWLYTHQSSVAELKPRLERVLQNEDDSDNRKVASSFLEMLKVSE